MAKNKNNTVQPLIVFISGSWRGFDMAELNSNQQLHADTPNNANQNSNIESKLYIIPMQILFVGMMNVCAPDE